MSEITVDQWRAEVERLNATQNDEGMTMRELSAIFGKSVTQTTRIVNAGVATGQYIAGHSTRYDAKGVLRPIQVYRVAKGK